MLGVGHTLQRAHVGELGVVDDDAHGLGRVDRRTAAQRHHAVGARSLERLDALLHVADRGVGLDLAVNLIGNVRPAEHLLDLRGHAEPDEVFVRYEQHLFKAPLADLVGDHRAAPCAVVRRLVQYDAVHDLSVWRLLPFRTAGSRR